MRQLDVACNQQLRAQRNACRCAGMPMGNYDAYLAWIKAEDYWIARGKKLFEQMREESYQEPKFHNSNKL